MGFTPKQFIKCFYKAGVDLVLQDGVEHAGYLSFLALLSLFPFLVFFVSLLGALGDASFGQIFVELLFQIVPPEFTNALQARIQEIVTGPPQGLLTLAIFGAIWTASSSVEGLRTILNRAYRVSTPPHYILRRLLSIVEFFSITVALFLAMSSFVLIPPIWVKIDHWINFDFFGFNFLSVSYVTAAFVLFIGISLIYYMLPNCKQKMHSVAPGAIIVVIGWLAAANVFVFYLKTFKQVNLIYGSLGGVIISLLFFYIINIIFIYGAEFNYHFERMLGHKPKEKDKTNY